MGDVEGLDSSLLFEVVILATIINQRVLIGHVYLMFNVLLGSWNFSMLPFGSLKDTINFGQIFLRQLVPEPVPQCLLKIVSRCRALSRHCRQRCWRIAKPGQFVVVWDQGQ